MKAIGNVFWALAAVLLFQVRLCGALLVVNDGTTTANLLKLSNTNEAGAAEAMLVSNNGVLFASQTNVVDNIPLRTVWFLSDQTPTSGVYTVAADFKPAEAEPRNRGGAMGWLGLGTRKGISLHVVPSGSGEQGFFQAALVDFTAADADSNESFANLFNLDGSPASEALTSARSDLASYDPARFATFQLEFSAPTAAEKQLTNLTATAHVTAKVFQADANNAIRQTGRTIELLTDLPIPANHRVGYYAYLASVFVDGPIGQLDNLSVGGGFGAVPNVPPGVSLTSPVEGATFIAPTNVTLAADAADSDGVVTQVKFFANTNLLGVATQRPYAVTWIDAPQGRYSLTAQATDNRGATTTSQVVSITVNSNLPPAVRITSPTNGSTFIEPANITITASASDSDGSVSRVDFFYGGTTLIDSVTASPYTITWTDVPPGTYSLTAQATDNRGLSATSSPVAVTVGSAVGSPPLSIRRATNSVIISWPAQFTGFRLQANTNLVTANWTDAASANNSATFPVTSGATRQFFRLLRP